MGHLLLFMASMLGVVIAGNLLTFFLFWISALANCEVINIYTCSQIFLDKEPVPEVISPFAYKIEAKVLEIDLEEESLSKIIKDAKPKSWVGEPFYGPVKEFIAKDSENNYFIIHFEYVEGHKHLGNGIRAAIIQTDYNPNNPKSQIEGYPYNGSSVFDRKLLDPLLNYVKTQEN